MFYNSSCYYYILSKSVYEGNNLLKILRMKFRSALFPIKKFDKFASSNQMVDVAQLVRASDCGSEGRRFEPGFPPYNPIGRLFFGVAGFYFCNPRI